MGAECSLTETFTTRGTRLSTYNYEEEREVSGALVPGKGLGSGELASVTVAQFVPLGCTKLMGKGPQTKGRAPYFFWVLENMLHHAVI